MQVQGDRMEALTTYRLVQMIRSGALMLGNVA